MEAQWKRRVKYEYKKIIKLRELKHTHKVNVLWKENKDEIFKFKIELNECQPKIKWQAGKLPRCVNKAKIVFDDNNDKPQKCSIVIIDPVKAIPSSYYWTSIRENIRVDDEVVLNHLPYMGDEVFKDNDTFLVDLVKHYQGKVHGKSGALDDDLFLQLVNSLVKYENSSPNKSRRKRKYEEIINPTVQLTRLPSVDIFNAIAAVFVDKGTSEDFMKKYLDLTEESDTLVVRGSPNIDNSDCISLSREQSLNAYHKYFCRQCFKYNCLLHRTKNTLDSKKLIGPRLELFTEPCSEYCYLNKEERKKLLSIERSYDFISEIISTEIQNLQFKYSDDINNNNNLHINNQDDDSKTSYQSFRNDEKEATEIIAEKDVRVNKHSKFTLSKIDENREIWTGWEETLLRAIYPAFPGNSCAIAQIIRTKTCEDVYEFLLREGHEIPTGRIEELSPPRVVKSKQRLWSIRNRKKHLIGNLKENVLCNYKPCDHPGKDCDDSCTCVGSHNFCEKYCNCSKECLNRYPGCNCKARCNTKQCPCYLAARECDPDLCQTCGADQFDVSKMTCRNVSVQRGLHKHLLLAPSDVAGWGIFLKESAVKNEFISEYCGEIISQDEADRRGKVYDKSMCSFLFNLNNEFVVDAMRKGNKIRFANHSINPNCYAKVMMVNGDHKIAIFAKQAIQSGEELFLDYRYGTTEQLKFVGIERKIENLHQ